MTVQCKWQLAEQWEHCPVQYILHVKRRDCTVYIVNDNWLKIVLYNTCDMWYICTVICDTGVTGHCTIYFRTGYCTVYIVNERTSGWTLYGTINNACQDTRLNMRHVTLIVLGGIPRGKVKTYLFTKLLFKDPVTHAIWNPTSKNWFRFIFFLETTRNRCIQPIQNLL